MGTQINNSVVNVENIVANYQQGHAAARSTKVVTGTINQARKSLGGVQDEPIVIGRDEDKKKVYTTVGSFLSTVGCPFTRGQVLLASITKAWNPYLKDSEGRMLICKNVVQRIKYKKHNYVLYRQDEEGKYKAVSIYEPAPVRDTSWTAYLICEGLAQSKFIDEIKAKCETSKAEFEKLRAEGGLFVHDELTGEYVAVTLK